MVFTKVPPAATCKKASLIAATPTTVATPSPVLAPSVAVALTPVRASFPVAVNLWSSG